MRHEHGVDVLGVMEDNPLWVTPAYTLDRMNRLNTAMTTFQQDVWRELPGPTQPFSLAFGAFKMDWDKFYQSNGPGASGWTSRLYGSTMDSVINYERRLEEWKTRFRQEIAAKGKGVGPLSSPTKVDPVTDPTNPQNKLPDDGMSLSTKILIGLGILGGTAVVGAGGYYLLKRFTPAGKLMSLLPSKSS